MHNKLKKILKGSLDYIPSHSHSVKIQIMSGNKKFVVITQQCFALLPQVNFPTYYSNFHWRWRWWDQMQTIFLNLFYFINFSLQHALLSFFLFLQYSEKRNRNKIYTYIFLLFLQVDLRHMCEIEGSNVVDLGIDLSEMYLSVEWDILEVPAVR